MRFTLLRPAILGYKNRLSSRAHDGRVINLEVLIAVISAGVMLGLYISIRALLGRAIEIPELSEAVPSALLRLGFFFFFTLLVISSFISAFGTFFEAKDIPLVLSSPISPRDFFAARFVETVFHSSWMFLLFGVPAIFAYKTVLDLSWVFVMSLIAIGVPFVATACAIGVACSILFVNVVPMARMTDVLAIVGFLLVLMLLIVQHQSATFERTNDRSLKTLAQSVVDLGGRGPDWSPARWPAELAEGFLTSHAAPPLRSALSLLGGAVGALMLSYWCFRRWYWRGWNLTLATSRKIRIHASPALSSFGRALFPFDQQFRALMVKEARMFLRDTVQALQLLFLLTVTCLYIYNFRALRYVSTFGEETHHWLHVFLCLVNLCFGGSVVAAIATRFVFPSISFEGRAYPILRGAPLSIAKLLRCKLIIWSLPMMAIGVTLVLSGAMALFVPPFVLLVSALIAVPIAVSSVALGIGVGAVYARFDWDSPSQVLSSFGSLIHLLLCVAVIGATAIPSAYLFVLSGVPRFSEHFSTMDWAVSLVTSFALIGCIHFLVIRAALRIGEESLAERER